MLRLKLDFLPPRLFNRRLLHKRPLPFSRTLLLQDAWPWGTSSEGSGWLFHALGSPSGFHELVETHTPRSHTCLQHQGVEVRGLGYALRSVSISVIVSALTWFGRRANYFTSSCSGSAIAVAYERRTSIPSLSIYPLPLPPISYHHPAIQIPSILRDYSS
jgi:hypothetical protein